MGAPTAIDSELRLSASGMQLADARRYIEQAARRFGLDHDQCYELVYAANEALTNAIRHGTPDRQGTISLGVVTEADRLTVSIHDSGRFLMPIAMTDPARSEHGRGFVLMERLLDDLRLEIEPEGTTVLLSKDRR